MSLQLAVFASGNGSNFQALIDAIEAGKLSAQILKLISDKAQSFALKRAQKHHIPHACFERKNFPTQESYEEAILKDLQKTGVEWIALAGYMKIVSSTLLQAFPNRILNIHPSLLPDFPGLNAIEQAWNAGARKMGCTLHFVDEGCDTGPIIAQSSFDVNSQDTLESVTHRMHEHEHRLYVQVLNWISEDKVKLSGRSVLIS